jgi:hypothetical protein
MGVDIHAITGNNPALAIVGERPDEALDQHEPRRRRGGHDQI